MPCDQPRSVPVTFVIYAACRVFCVTLAVAWPMFDAFLGGNGRVPTVRPPSWAELMCGMGR